MSPVSFTPTCSVVICTRNRPQALDRCLQALAQLAYPHYEVLVVDNAPSDGRALEVARRWGARYLVEPAPGLSRARNSGARACSSEVIAFTDDDAVPEPLWLSRLAAQFRDPGVAAVTGRTVPLFDGAAVAISPDETADLGPKPIRLHRSQRLWFERACFGGIGNGNNMAFRRQAFEWWRGFDERLGRGALVSSGEEHRAFAQLVESGCAVVYTPDAIVRHRVPQTPEERRDQYLRSRSDLAAYAVYLLLVTRQRWRITRYLAEAAVGTRRTWRCRTEAVPPDIVPRLRLLRACVTGAWTCVWSLMRLGLRTDVPGDPIHTLRTRAGTVTLARE
jgi:cellulose synthase/poly-beta-1,6-N-acetylglucosamine synthase-like glycosyltransferase